MSGFETLPNAIAEGVAQAPITAPEVRSANETWDDDTALGIVLQDTWDTMTYLQSKGLVPVGIDAADDLVRGYVPARQWPNGKPRANLSMHVTLQAIEKILPALYMSLFGQGKKQPFIVNPVGQTKPEAARAQASLLSWAMKQAKTKEEMRLCLKTALTYGFTVGCWGWESKTQRKKVYTANKNDKGKPTSEWKTEDIEIPSFECLDLKMVLVDPCLKRQDVQAGAKFVVKQFFTDGYGLADFRANDKYKNIPTDEELAEFLAAKSEPTEDTLAGNKRAIWREFQAKLESESTSKDPMMQPLEILEYTSEDRVVTVLQRKLVIRNEENEFGKLNFQSCAFIDVLGSAWGFGVAKLLAGEQRLQAGVANNWIDGMALVLNPVYQLLKGIGPGTQSIPVSPGKVITESGELKPLITPDISKPAAEMIASSDQRANEKVGANGGSNMPNQAMRTAEGVNAFAGDVIQRLQYFLEIFINLVYLPTLEAFLAIMKDHLTIEQVQSILTAEQGKAYEGDISDVYNADVDVDVIAGANMMAKFAAAQLAPMIIQLVSAGPVADQLEVAGKKFLFDEFAMETLDMMGWDIENLFADMTPDDLQRVKEKNAAMIKTQGDLMLQNAKHEDNLSEIDAKGSVQAGVATVRQILKTHSDQAVAQVEAMQNPESAQNGGTQ
ncbi:MAG: hypothetical protein WAU89_13435 [Candidatus Acidiferrales bacterium]